MVNLGTALGVVLANCPQTLDRRDAEMPRSVVSPRQKLLSKAGTQSKTPSSPKPQ
jgi:hypothetical protein